MVSPPSPTNRTFILGLEFQERNFVTKQISPLTTDLGERGEDEGPDARATDRHTGDERPALVEILEVTVQKSHR